MKQLLLFTASIFFFGVINAQKYISLTNNRKGWCFQDYFFQGNSTGGAIESAGDTTINGKEYTTYYRDSSMFLKNDRNMLIRDDIQAKKVFRFNTVTQTEELLYDFSFGVGDTITVNFKAHKPVLMTVNKVDSIQAKGIWLTVIYFTHGDTIAGTSHLSKNFRWIEGVGSNWYPNYPDRFLIEDSAGWRRGYAISCAYDNGGRIFTNTESFIANHCLIVGLGCKMLNSTPFVAKSSLKVYPSPFTNYLTIETENLEETTLYDMLGRVVYHSEIKTTNPVLVYFEDELEAGYYQLEVKTKAGILTQKVMKK